MPPKNASTSVTPRERSEAPARAPAASPESYAATGPDVISAPPSQAHQRVELLAREHARVPARFPTPPKHQQRGDRPDAESLGRHRGAVGVERSEEHTSELQSPCNLVCRLLLEKKKTDPRHT